MGRAFSNIVQQMLAHQDQHLHPSTNNHEIHKQHQIQYSCINLFQSPQYLNSLISDKGYLNGLIIIHSCNTLTNDCIILITFLLLLKLHTRGKSLCVEYLLQFKTHSEVL